MDRWSPPEKLSKQEQLLMKRLTRVRALFGFLRLHRHELFDESFQEQLESMYRTTGAGEPPHPPTLMGMVTLLQGYVGASDAEAVEPTRAPGNERREGYERRTARRDAAQAGDEVGERIQALVLLRAGG